MTKSKASNVNKTLKSFFYCHSIVHLLLYHSQYARFLGDGLTSAHWKKRQADFRQVMNKRWALFSDLDILRAGVFEQLHNKYLGGASL